MGALTSKPYAFSARSWELRSIESVDVLDTEGANIKVNIRGNAIMRVLPRINYDINMEWISDRIRFSYDGNQRQRLIKPILSFSYISKFLNISKFSDTAWVNSLNFYKTTYENSFGNLRVIAGSVLDFETFQILDKFSSKLGQSHNFFFEDAPNLRINFDLVNYFSFMIPLNLFSSIIQTCFFVGFNPRLESPILNIRLRGAVNRRQLKIFTFGCISGLNYVTYNLGNSIVSVVKLLEGRYKVFSAISVSSSKIAVIFGALATMRADFAHLISSFQFIATQFLITRKQMILNTVLPTVSLTNALFLGLGYSIKWSYAKNYFHNSFFYIVNSGNLVLNVAKSFIVYQGSHFNSFELRNGNLLLPSLTFYEKKGTFRNMGGEFQSTRIAVNPLSDKIKSDWRIVKAFADYLNIDSIHLERNIDTVGTSVKSEVPTISNLLFLKKKQISKNFFRLNFSSFRDYENSFYFVDPITRNSVTMALVASVLNSKFNNFNIN